MLNRKSLVWFLAIAFGLAWILFLLPLAFGSPESMQRQTVTLISWTLAMWAPGLAAIIVTRFVNKKKLGTLNLRKLGDWRAYLWAWLLPLALTIVTGILTWAFRAGQLDLEFTIITEAAAMAEGSPAIPTNLLVAIQILFALTLAPLINTIPALGEELGWRGFLLPQLLPLGQFRAILFSGVIWGLWHAPAVLLGLNYPSRPIAGIFMMIVFTVLLGAIFSWLYLRTLSPWAPALAHGSLNAIAGLPVIFLTGVDIVIGGTLPSLIGWIPLALFVGWLIWTRRLPVTIPEADAPPPDSDENAYVSRET
jgi:membrane protease YdiL (CAAX protease family)